MHKSKNQKNQTEISRKLNLLAKSSFIVLVGLIISKVLTYAHRIIIARYFGAEVYGLFSLAFIIIGFLVAFFSFGLSMGLLRYIPYFRGKNENNRINNIFRFSINFSLITSLIAAILLYFSAGFISLNIFNNSGLIIFLKIFSFLIPIYIFANIYSSLIRAYEQIGWYSFITNILSNIVKIIILVIFLILGMKVNSIIFSYFLGILSILIMSYIIARYKFSDIFIKDNLDKITAKNTRKEFFSYSWPLMFWSSISFIFFWIDSFFIGYMLDATSVGWYNAAVPIAALMGIAPELFMQLFFPLITRENSKGNKLVVRELTKQVGKWIFVLVLPLFLLFYFFPGMFIRLFFGSEYLSAIAPLKILSLVAFISASIVPLSNNLVSMIGKSKLLLANLVFASLINIIFNIILIPKYGINGAAFATLLSTVLLSIMLLIEVYIFVKMIPFRRKMLQIFVLSIIPLSILIYFKDVMNNSLLGFLLLIFFFILLYTLLIFLTKSLDKHDFSVLKAIKNKAINIKKITFNE